MPNTPDEGMKLAIATNFMPQRDDRKYLTQAKYYMREYQPGMPPMIGLMDTTNAMMMNIMHNDSSNGYGGVGGNDMMQSVSSPLLSAHHQGGADSFALSSLGKLQTVVY